MSRRIVTSKPEGMEAGNEKVDTYSDKLVKNIPAEVVGIWVAISSLVNAASADYPKATILWIVFAIGVITTPLWIKKQTDDPKKKTALTQITISTAAFIIWVFALGGPFSYLGFYRPLYGAILLILYTFMVALINPKEDNPVTH